MAQAASRLRSDSEFSVSFLAAAGRRPHVQVDKLTNILIGACDSSKSCNKIITRFKVMYGHAMKEGDQRVLLWCVLLFALPIIAALLPQLFVELLVPRGHVKDYVGDLTRGKLGPAAYGGLYQVAIGATITFVIC